MKYYLVSVYCYLLEQQLHLKLAAYSLADAEQLSTAVNIGAVIYEIPKPTETDNRKLIAYHRGEVMVFA